jgi:hypothetical protein
VSETWELSTYIMFFLPPHSKVSLTTFTFNYFPSAFYNSTGLAITQADTRRLPTAAASVPSQVGSCGICGGQVALGQVFSECFGFPCQFSFNRMPHKHHHLSSGAGIIDKTVYQVDSVSPHPMKLKKKNSTSLCVKCGTNSLRILRILHQ